MSETSMSEIRAELLTGPYAPLLDTDPEDRLDLTRAAHKFSSVPSEHNARELVGVLNRFTEAKIADGEDERFDALVELRESDARVAESLKKPAAEAIEEPSEEPLAGDPEREGDGTTEGGEE